VLYLGLFGVDTHALVVESYLVPVGHAKPSEQKKVAKCWSTWYAGKRYPQAGCCLVGSLVDIHGPVGITGSKPDGHSGAVHFPPSTAT